MTMCTQTRHVYRSRNVLSPLPSPKICHVLISTCHASSASLYSEPKLNVEITSGARDGKGQNKCNNKCKRVTAVSSN